MEFSLVSAKPSPRAAAAAASAPRSSPTAARLRGRRFRCAAAAKGEQVFGGRKELTGVQPLVEALPPAARAVVELAVVAAAATAGYGLGTKYGGGSRTAAVAGAAVLGAASLAGAAAVNSVVPDVAAVGLHNYVAGCDDPTKLETGDVEAIAKKYGVSTEDAAFKSELCDLYGSFVYSVLPPGHEDLKGNEVEAIIKFKRALGLNDVDAANMHMAIGRRLYKERLNAFQKLIFVSNLVFGDASDFLLPWKHLFGITDYQIDIAMRENAKTLYASELKSIGRGLDIGTLIELRRSQLAYKLFDEVAADMFREHAKKLILENIASALAILKSQPSTAITPAQVIDEVNSIIAFNSLLRVLSKFPQGDRFARGLGPISLGGEYDHELMVDDLKILYTAYAREVLSDSLDDEKLVSLIELRNIFGLGKLEAEEIIANVKSRVLA
ncbi:protein TIC110, chloroplastic [Brachypodium distachyon]|uniref:protein TIC110, chloroplastic n=1 Tax=Brachypodium distachyon TaxID=15368 RepID=UPI0001C73C36|nr:protein TIC110, chloroplastic [Brachypodium distachyon]|eukprot:XP_010234859.1 protein TIC110, chloroplastic [Brachypodium distachyon]